jgi:hypothetical protein
MQWSPALYTDMTSTVRKQKLSSPDSLSPKKISLSLSLFCAEAAFKEKSVVRDLIVSFPPQPQREKGGGGGVGLSYWLGNFKKKNNRKRESMSKGERRGNS